MILSVDNFWQKLIKRMTYIVSVFDDLEFEVMNSHAGRDGFHVVNKYITFSVQNFDRELR